MSVPDIDLSTLPSWVEEIRPHQLDAVENILDAYDRGVDVVVLGAPTGSGKSLVAKVTQMQRGSRATYIAHSLDLQDQFSRDFPDSRVIKGRANYPTIWRPDLTTADCEGKDCGYCGDRASCPYEMAKTEAFRAEMAVVNVAYLLSANVRALYRDLMIVDECDTLEGALLRHYEVFLGAGFMAKLGVEPPVKGARVATIARWLDGEVIPRLSSEIRYLEEGEANPKRQMLLKRYLDSTTLLANQLRADELPWIREYQGDHFRMVPVEVSEQGAAGLWRKGNRAKWLTMSGTIIDAQEWCRSVGVEAAGLRWDYVEIPNTWDRRHRPIVTKTFGDMGRKGTEQDRERVLARIVAICESHVGENILIHSVNYRLANEITDALFGAGISATTYGSAKERSFALDQFRKVGGVLVAPSMDRGVDLPDDMCRVIIVAKMPYPNLGDRRVQERMKLPGGALWYQVQTARSLVQMTGRGVRHDSDRCVTYVVDSAFDKFYRKYRRLLPKWWRLSVEGELPPDWKEGKTWSK